MARLFDALLAAIFLVAWVSLGVQIDVLVGHRGLLPAEPWAASMRTAGAHFADAPSIFVALGAGDAALHAGIAAGIVLAVLALAGVAPRLCFGLSALLYLSFAVVCRTFLSFQWDNLLLECGLCAALLPRDRRAPWAHFILRFLLFKLYFESGIAKWQSGAHDWQDGSAMRFYYETAPLPARLGWYFHALPATFHRLESWFTLFFELVVPFGIFGPRRVRLGALAIFTLFQVVNVATASYGFFCYLAVALHLFLLDESDVVRARTWLERRAPLLHRGRVWQRWLRVRGQRILGLTLPASLRRRAAFGLVSTYVVASLADATAHFSQSRVLLATAQPLRRAFASSRMINTYHLFGAITQERVEPELQTFDGTEWTAHDLRYKPGDVMRAPSIVAPHQPRVDFQLWFYGLSYRRGMPPYVAGLLERACYDPGAVRTLFTTDLPAAPEAARMAFFRYHFTTPDERRRTGAWWTRESVEASKPLQCQKRTSP